MKPNNSRKRTLNINPMKKLFILLLLFSGVINAQIVNIPNANFKTKLISLGVDTNNDGQIQNIEALAITDLDVSSSNISNLTGILSFLNITKLTCSNNALATLNVSNLNNLVELRCNNNFLTAINVGGTNLYRLDCSYNQLTILNLNGLPNEPLFLDCNNNNLISLNFGTLSSLSTLNCSNNQLTTLELSNITIIYYGFNCSNNLLASLITPLSGSVYCSNNQLTSLILNTYNTDVDCSNNLLTSLGVSGHTGFLNCSNNQLTNLNVTGASFAKLNCSNNSLSTLDLTNTSIGGNDSTSGIDCSFNQLSGFTFDNTLISNFKCNNNLLVDLDLSGVTLTKSIDCSNNQLTNINFGNNSKTPTINVKNNLLTSIDISNCFLITGLNCSDNLLSTIFAKNGRNEYIDFTNNPDLIFICADQDQISSLASVALSTTAVNSYCNFFPGGKYNTIAGVSRLDADNNGCSTLDFGYSNLRINISDGFDIGSTFTNSTGNYKFFTQSLDYVLTPALENPLYFNVAPTSIAINFIENSYLTQNQDFCVTPNGVHNDLEVIIYPVRQAKPSFDSEYILVYKNKGNQVVSGSVNLNFNDTLTDFVSSNPALDSQTFNTLTWNYFNLLPLQSRTINFTLNINDSNETPPVNNGAILAFTATINPSELDEVPNDNTFAYNQTVVDLYNPNNITCLQGENLPSSQIGTYLYYSIQFENTGTSTVANVVLRQTIDSNKFNLSSLQILNSSAEVRAVITNNVLELIFEGINLVGVTGNPPVGGHGDVLFKIKTNNNIANNASVFQKAGIYFDYNFPIVTNDAETTFGTLNSQVFEKDNSVKVYPNPTKSIVNIESNFNIQSIELYDVQGRILETILATKTISRLDLSSQASGIYFLKIKTDKGSKVEKVVKK
ncbi:MAG: T9SS type A sorting domain-containing protein [Flavobacterium sp.]|nr:T9SS type A sorting domain-containing protein [Flavobacterium sp.]